MRYQKVLRHGHSLAVVIPVALARALDIQRGDVVTLKTIQTERVEGRPVRFGVEIWPVVEVGEERRIKING